MGPLKRATIVGVLQHINADKGRQSVQEQPLLYNMKEKSFQRLTRRMKALVLADVSKHVLQD